MKYYLYIPIFVLKTFEDNIMCYSSMQKISNFQINWNIMKPEMSNLDVALLSFWQLARHWKQGDIAKLELSCEAGSLHIQLSAKLGHPDHIHFPQSLGSSSWKKKSPSQLRRQECRRQQAPSKSSNENISQESDKQLLIMFLLQNKLKCWNT